MTAPSLLHVTSKPVDSTSKKRSEVSPFFSIALVTTLIQTSILSHWDNDSVSLLLLSLLVPFDGSPQSYKKNLF